MKIVPHVPLVGLASEKSLCPWKSKETTVGGGNISTLQTAYTCIPHVLQHISCIFLVLQFLFTIIKTFSRSIALFTVLWSCLNVVLLCHYQDNFITGFMVYICLFVDFCFLICIYYFQFFLTTIKICCYMLSM